MKEGKIQDVGRFRSRVLNLLENAEKGTDISLKVPGVPPSNIAYGMGITAVPESLCNSHAATYFEFNSLMIEYSDEYEFPKE